MPFIYFLKKHAWWITSTALLGSCIYIFYEKPCENPITYRIGRIDPGFGISESTLKQAITAAENVWGKAASSQLFMYDEQGDLVINLIYDERQMTTQQNLVLKADVEKESKLADSIRAEYKSLMQDLEDKKDIYASALASFENRQKKYADEVDYWNGQGGAPSDAYNRLEQERMQLIQSQQILEEDRQTINQAANKINAFITKYNLIVQDTNKRINTINQTAGKEFQEGTYDPNTNTITIYEFSTQDKLVRVLAHEFGHALGLEHNDNPQSIMYGLNQSSTLTLSKDDTAALKALCEN